MREFDRNHPKYFDQWLNFVNSNCRQCQFLVGKMRLTSTHRWIAYPTHCYGVVENQKRQIRSYLRFFIERHYLTCPFFKRTIMNTPVIFVKINEKYSVWL